MAKKKIEEVIEEKVIEEVIEEKPVKKAAKKKDTGVVNVESLNIRPEASTDNKPIGLLSKGDKIKILEKVDEWYRFDGGFVMSKFVDVK